MEDTKVEEEVKTKICQKCGRTLPLGEFAKNKTKKDGLANWCKACTKAYNVEYYQAHKDKIAEYYQANKDKIAEYYQANKEKKAAYYAEYYQANKDKIAEYYQANKDKIAEYYQANKDKIAEYYQANKEKKAAYNDEYRDPQKNPIGWAKSMVGGYRAMDRQRGFDDSQTITAEWFLQNIAYKPCKYCGKQGIGLIGCNRLDNTKPHTIDNVEPCCFKCNCKENIRDQLERGIHMSCKHKKQSFSSFVEEHKAKRKNLT